MMSAKVVRSLLALTLVSALAAMPALFMACGGDDDDGGQSGDDNGGEADAGEPDSGGGTQADASTPADASPGDLDSGSTDFGPECQRYLTCCEMGASADECEAAVEAGGSDPDAQEMFCKIAADASGCP